MKKNVLGMIAALFVFMLLLPADARAADNVYAILYTDGLMVFQNGYAAESGRTVANTYPVDLTATYIDMETETVETPWYEERESVRIVSFATKISPTSTAAWFAECSNLRLVDNIRNLDTSNVTNMLGMFDKCGSLTKLDVSGFDTANVTDMYGMFSGCGSLTALDVSGFDTANVTDMGFMFDECDGLTKLDVSGFDTANVTNMWGMFSDCSALTKLDVSGFDTANVTDMRLMFHNCKGLTTLDVSGFDTAKVTDTRFMFSGCSGLTELDLSRFDTAKVESMESMFSGCSSLKTIYASEKFVTASVPEAAYYSQNMFTGCASLVGGNGSKYSESHTDKAYARIDAASAPGYFTEKPAADIAYAILYDDGTLAFQNSNIPETGRKVTKTYEVDLNAEYTDFWRSDTYIANTPWYNERESVHVVSFIDKISPTSTACWFYKCYNLERMDNIQNLDTANVTTMSAMFSGCSGLTALDLSHWNTANVTTMSAMFSGCSGLTALDLSHWNTANVTSMRLMFQGCKGLTALDLFNWDTVNVTDMTSMFMDCLGLKTLDLSNFDVSNAGITHMFYECSGLITLDLSYWNTTNITDMRYMFFYCRNLKTIYVSDKFKTNAVKNSTSMFAGCTSLVGGNGTKYSESHTDKAYARIDTASAPGYFTAKPVNDGFDVKRDAYQIGNSMEAFGYKSRGGKDGGQYPIPPQSFFMIFGEGVRAQLLYKNAANSPWSGNCAGMSASAALLFAYGKLNPSDFGKDNAWSLAIGDKNAEMSLLTFVEAMQAAQYTTAFGQVRQANQVRDARSMDSLYQAVKGDMEKGRPTLIAIVKNGVGGHALLAVGTDAAGKRILIYDCNHPGELRYLTLSGDAGWSYDMGGYGVWGSGDAACSISYVPYAVLEDIWANRGALKQDMQVLTVNASDAAITDYLGNPVATLENGKLVTSAAGVYEMVDLSMYWPEERIICLPRNKVYTVSTGGDTELTASMTDLHMSAAITTSANSVTFGVNDDERANVVTIAGASASDTYSISLQSDFADFLQKTVELSGTGQGQDVNISMTQSRGVTFVNCNITSLSVDGEDVYAITAAKWDKSGKLSATLINPKAATFAVAYFGENGKFVSANLQDVSAHAGTVTSSVPANAKTARVMLFDKECRPLCDPYQAAVG